ncbi:ribosome silencing factor [Xylophilus sp.]|uniref:ribosome silencing factor n=1 Tax=Xylophilus sp. TaxID=2653893 RepID=UPI0013B9F029|nr:ribosome silencing factor [Xylophilus sp.]KAF1049389.1 MAG: Ribosomal silencing factor RsfS [Xylophilus sp.]
MTTNATKSEAAAKKDIQKLQRAIVDGLEDVKAQDIQVFNTEQLSPLFERVIVASGTSNRQTKALASSVRDAVREAGFAKPRTEGEDNGEWIIVDCGSAVVHVMQPAIRQYYRLEEIWGATPVRLKGPAVSRRTASDEDDASPRPARKAAARKAPAAAKKAAGRSTVTSASGLRTSDYRKLPDAVEEEASQPARKAAARKVPAAAAKKAAAAPAKAPARKTAAGSATAAAARKPAARKTPAKTVVVNKPAKAAAAKKAPAAASKAPARKAPARAR